MATIAIDMDIIDQETERLSTEICNSNYYRYRKHLYDPFKYLPLFTIEEYVWTFTKYPKYAKKIVSNLEKSLEDVPKIVNRTEIIQTIKIYLNRVENVYSKNISNKKPLVCIEVSRMFRFLSKSNNWYIFRYNDRFISTTERKLREFFNSEWLPAKDFYRKMFGKDMPIE